MKHNLLKKIIVVIFALYAIILLRLLIFRHSVYLGSFSDYLSTLGQNFNPIPFKTILFQVRYARIANIFFVNIVGNLVIFIPMGFFLPVLFPKRCGTFFRYSRTCALMIASVELVQLFSLEGVFDVDDIILNMISVSVGYFAFLPVRRHMSRWS